MHQNLKIILESMPEGVLIFQKDDGQEVLYKNDKIEELLSVSESKQGTDTHLIFKQPKID